MTKKFPEKVEEFRGVKMTYKQLGSSLLHQIMSKLNQTEISDLASARRINQVHKALIKVLDAMSERYIEEIQKPFHASLKEAGIDYEEGQAVPDLTEEQTKVFEKLKAENEKLISKFEEVEVMVECVPLAPQHLREVKISAAQLDAMGPLVDELGFTRQVAMAQSLSKAR